MPQYEFKCLTCGDHPFDVTRPASQSDDPAACPACQGSDTRRVYSFSARAQIPKLMARAADHSTRRP